MLLFLNFMLIKNWGCLSEKFLYYRHLWISLFYCNDAYYLLAGKDFVTLTSKMPRTISQYIMSRDKGIKYFLDKNVVYPRFYLKNDIRNEMLLFSCFDCVLLHLLIPIIQMFPRHEPNPQPTLSGSLTTWLSHCLLYLLFASNKYLV